MRVLLAEDNEINVKITARYLRQWGVSYDVARNGQEALDKARANSYDIVLMDLLMPEKDGYEATTDIRALADSRFSEVPIIALSASLFDDVKERIRTTGMNGYLDKPFKPQDLYGTLYRYYRRHHPSANNYN
ncbi:MAG: hypothetical protein OHK0039_08050 [Bacteroidia bacterium]